MSPQIKGKDNESATGKNTMCLCNHCQSIRKQQAESELIWIRLHQSFDR